MRYEHQTAKLTRKLTGMRHGHALQMARTGATERHHPVPDAFTADQRAFEARIAFALVDAFPEHLQPGGFPWAIAAVTSNPTGLDIHPAPGATEHLLGAIVPYHDRQYGGIRGTSGARVTITDQGWWILRDLHTAASVRIAAPASADLRRGRYRGSSPRARRLIVAAALTTEERRDLAHIDRLAQSHPDHWQAHRDVLGSRLLRRPGLIQRLAQAHGHVNIYTHAGMDIVLEWCCGPTSDEFSSACGKAGIVADLAGQLLPGTTIKRSGDFVTTMKVGHARLSLQHNTWACVDS
jgi:hypothetical protein